MASSEALGSFADGPSALQALLRQQSAGTRHCQEAAGMSPKSCWNAGEAVFLLSAFADSTSMLLILLQGDVGVRICRKAAVLLPDLTDICNTMLHVGYWLQGECILSKDTLLLTGMGFESRREAGGTHMARSGEAGCTGAARLLRRRQWPLLLLLPNLLLLLLLLLLGCLKSVVNAGHFLAQLVGLPHQSAATLCCLLFVSRLSWASFQGV